MRQRKQNTIAELEKIREAIAKLSEARELAKAARVSERSIDRIRAAIKSLGGAERYASGSITRSIVESAADNRAAIFEAILVDKGEA